MKNLPAHQSHFSGKNVDDKALRLQLKNAGIDARRLSRLTQLCLLAALPLQSHLTPNTSVYFGSPFSSPSKFTKLFHQLNEHQIPSPLDFMANINNAPTFQLTQQFGLTGNSIFLITNHHNFWQPLELALLDLELAVTEQALVGWGIEAQNEEMGDGVVWWIVTREDREIALQIVNETYNSSKELKYQDIIVNLTKNVAIFS